MKTAAKVFIWIGIILQWYLVYPVVIGAFALKRIKTAKSKDELQAFGILTAILCSILGGILMLCIKDEELIETPAPFSNITEQQTDTVTIEKQEQEPTPIVLNKTKGKDKKLLKISVCAIFVLLAICLILCIAISLYYDCGFIPLIFNSCQIVVFVFITIIFFLNKGKMTKDNFVLFIAFITLTTALIIMTMISNYSFTSDYDNRTLLGNCEYHLAIFLIAVAVNIFSILIVSLNPLAKQTHTNKETAAETSNIEQELNQLKRMYEINLIEKDEYDRLRLFIISKYYE